MPIVLESTGYLGRSEAIKHGGIQLSAVRNNQHPGDIKLRMLVQLRLLKKRRYHVNPSVHCPSSPTPSLLKLTSPSGLRLSSWSIAICLLFILLRSYWCARLKSILSQASGYLKLKTFMYIQISDRQKLVPIRRTARNISSSLCSSSLTSSSLPPSLSTSPNTGFNRLATEVLHLIGQFNATIHTSSSYAMPLSFSFLSNFS